MSLNDMIDTAAKSLHIRQMSRLRSYRKKHPTEMEGKFKAHSTRYRYLKWLYMWTGVVSIMCLAQLPISSANTRAKEPSREEMWGILNSHTESLRKLSPYLHNMDIFWNWYQTNYRNIERAIKNGVSPQANLTAKDFKMNPQDIKRIVQATLAEEFGSQTSAISSLHLTIANVTKEADAQRQRADKLQETLAKQGEELERQMKVIDNLTKEAADNTSKMMEFVRRLAESANRSAETLRAEFAGRLQEAAGDVDNQELQKLKASLHQTNTIQNQLNSTVQLTSQKLSGLQAQLDEAQMKHVPLQNEIGLIQGSLSKITSANEQTSLTIRSLQSQVNDLSTRSAKLENLNSSVIQSFVEVSSRIDRLENRISNKSAVKILGDQILGRIIDKPFGKLAASHSSQDVLKGLPDKNRKIAQGPQKNLQSKLGKSRIKGPPTSQDLSHIDGKSTMGKPSNQSKP